LSLAVGAVAAGSAICLATYFIVGGPFGAINDFGNAAIAVLSGALAWRLRDQLSGRARVVGLLAAIGGAGVAIVGSGLVVSGTTGFLLAGLVSSLGFAGIGAWLLLLSRSAGASGPRTLRALATAAAALMLLGVVGTPGIALRIYDMATAPGWVWVALLSWLGIYLVYPIWAIAFGTHTLGAATGERLAHAAGTSR
jgi:hypothetical protein